MALIRGINQDSFKQAVVKSFVVLANLTGSKLIAEGIETMEELRTLLSLGVHAGQGYLLGRPASVPTQPDAHVMETLRFLNRAGTVLHAYNTRLIGEIAEPVSPVGIQDRCVDVRRHLDENRYEGVCVLDGDRIAGLVMRNDLNESLSRQYRYALYANRPIARILGTAPLVVDSSTPIGNVTELALNRNGVAIYHNIVVTRNGRYAGMVSIIRLLRHAMEIERSYALELNPLTGLPGNVQINRVLLETIRNGMEVGILYFDLDHFKVYNDLYGFEQGDGIIQLLKLVLCDVIKSDHDCASFIGHIGGDDFIAVLTCSEAECGEICREVILRFANEVDACFTQEHREQGGFPDPHGGLLPLTSLSVAGTYGHMDGFDSPESLARHVAGLKKQVKAIRGDAWMMENHTAGTMTGSFCHATPVRAC
jgi:GGDEF domain-containing protein